MGGKAYTKENLHKVPEKISSCSVSTKNNAKVVGFFGELSPFSNFCPAPFTHNGQEYHCAEQLIQHEKAKLFGDLETGIKILRAKSGLECKQTAHDTENYEHDHWIEQAPALCKPGIKAKYEQNSKLKELLLDTGNKTIVECLKDRDWGTGVPLGHFDCLSEDKWHSHGIMGPLLMEIRNELRGNTDAPLPASTGPVTNMEVT